MRKLIIGLCVIAGAAFFGCSQANDDPAITFVPVTAITGVPATTVAETPLALTGRVEPADATYQTIVWSVKNPGATGAVLEDKVLTSAAAGTVTVTATIAGGLSTGNYAQDFAITVDPAPSPPSVPVSAVSGVPTAMTAGESLTLSGTVEPANATNTTIVWSVKTAGATGASINGATLNAAAAGTVTVTATIAGGSVDGGNYTQDFAITVALPASVPVSGVSNVPAAMTVGEPLALSGTVEPDDASNTTIVWSVKTAGATGATIDGAVLNATALGTVTVTATIAGGLATGNYVQDFDISVEVKPVSGVSDVPSTMTVGEPLTLSGTVEPADATNKTIVWSVKTAGATGASIDGAVLNAAAAGTVTVTATIAGGLKTGDYTQDFAITVELKPVSGVSGVPSTMTVGAPLTLSGTVEPDDATNKTIVWTVKTAGATGASIDGAVLNAASLGTVTVTATIAGGLKTGEYTKDFAIAVENKAVSGVSGVPGVMTVGEPLTLSGAVEPADATNTTIVWSLKTAGATGATIDGAILNAAAAGTATVTAAIAGGRADGGNYTQDFDIVAELPGSVPVSNISGVPSTMTAGEPLALSGTVEPGNATNKTIAWSLKTAGATGATINGATLNAAATGTVTVTATIAGGLSTGNYTQDFPIAVEGKPVSGVSDVPSTMWAGEPLTLSGTVEPADATNKTIVWSVKTAGTTGASINGAILSAAAPGTVRVTATIAGGLKTGDYTQDFDIAATLPQGALAITVGFNQGIEITGGSGVAIIRKIGSPSSLTLSATGYADVAWHVDGGATAVATGDTFVIDAADYSAQNHSVTFTGKKDGKPYSKAMPFTVVN